MEIDLQSLPDDPRLLKLLLAKSQAQLQSQRSVIVELEQSRQALDQDRQALEQSHQALDQHRQALAAQVQGQLETIGELTRANDGLTHRMMLLLRRLFGPRAERIDPAQLLFFGLEMAQAVQAEAAPPVVAPVPGLPGLPGLPGVPGAKPAVKGHGRAKLPADLPRVQMIHDLPAQEKTCPCGQCLVKIGEVITEQLDYTPASLFVTQHVQHKYVCRACPDAGVITAVKPIEGQVIDKGLPGPGLVAQVVVSKYTDHQPLYRLESILERHGVAISRSTMCDWVAASARRLEPLYDLMAQEVRAGKILHTDDTPVQVQDPAPEYQGRTRTGRFWVYRGDDGHPYTVFEYTPNRKRDGPAQWLANFKGFLQADAFGGYDGIYATGQVVEVACWAHARRKFYDLRDQNPPVAHQALAQIHLLYDLERQAKEKKLDSAGRLKLRQEKAVPILDKFGQWLKTLVPGGLVLPKSDMAKAIGYVLNQWEALNRYTADGDLTIDNNLAENALRGIGIGRKNWLFLGSDRGGKTAAILYSLLASAKRHDVEPFLYLRDVLSRIGDTPVSQIGQFLPDRWKVDFHTKPLEAST